MLCNAITIFWLLVTFFITHLVACSMFKLRPKSLHSANCSMFFYNFRTNPPHKHSKFIACIINFLLLHFFVLPVIVSHVSCAAFLVTHRLTISHLSRRSIFYSCHKHNQTLCSSLYPTCALNIITLYYGNTFTFINHPLRYLIVVAIQITNE